MIRKYRFPLILLLCFIFSGFCDAQNNSVTTTIPYLPETTPVITYIAGSTGGLAFAIPTVYCTGGLALPMLGATLTPIAIGGGSGAIGGLVGSITSEGIQSLVLNAEINWKNIGIGTALGATAGIMVGGVKILYLWLTAAKQPEEQPTTLQEVIGPQESNPLTNEPDQETGARLPVFKKQIPPPETGDTEIVVEDDTALRSFSTTSESPTQREPKNFPNNPSDSALLSSINTDSRPNTAAPVTDSNTPSRVPSFRIQPAAQPTSVDIQTTNLLLQKTQKRMIQSVCDIYGKTFNEIEQAVLKHMQEKTQSFDDALAEVFPWTN